MRNLVEKNAKEKVLQFEVSACFLSIEKTNLDEDGSLRSHRPIFQTPAKPPELPAAGALSRRAESELRPPAELPATTGGTSGETSGDGSFLPRGALVSAALIIWPCRVLEASWMCGSCSREWRSRPLAASPAPPPPRSPPASSRGRS